MQGVLVVDDSADDRLLLGTYLRSEGFGEVLNAESAQQAFHYLGMPELVSTPAVELVIMDVLMPEINGIQACKHIRAAPGAENLPILMISAHDESEWLDQALAAGATDYVPKPVNRAQLMMRVRAAVALKQQIDHRKARESELTSLRRQLDRANEQIELLKRIDDLTGVANWRHLDERLDNAWRRDRRVGNELALIAIDVDFLKAYNTRYGYVAGDECLKLIARTLHDKLHRVDDLVARYGGGGFVVLLPATSAEGAIHVAEQMRHAIEGLGIPHAASEIGDCVTVSAGVFANVPSERNSPVVFMLATDRALYRAKIAGRNRVAVEIDAVVPGVITRRDRASVIAPS